MNAISMSALPVTRRIVSSAAPIQMAGDDPCAVEAERIVDEIEADHAAASVADAGLPPGQSATET